MAESLEPPTLAQIERAIDEVVSTLVAYRDQAPKGAERARRSAERVESGASIQELLGTERAVLRARDLTYSPVEIGLKHSLKELGKLAFAIVGDEKMLELAERICDLDPGNWGRRMAPIDSAWDGIGSWHA